MSDPSRPKIVRSEAEWRARLTPEQYSVAREGGTERAFTGPWWNEHRPGTYSCTCCGTQLFRSETKFDSGTGWPSFFAPAASETIATREDTSHGMRRTEALCTACEAHLGHVFPDGPPPTGLRYCMNGTALAFTPDEQEAS